MISDQRCYFTTQVGLDSMSHRDVWLSRVGWRVASILFGQEVAPPSTPFLHCLLNKRLHIHREVLQPGDILLNIHSECLAAVVFDSSLRFIRSPLVMIFFWSCISVATEPYSPSSLVSKKKSAFGSSPT